MINKVILVGRLTRDAEQKQSQSGIFLTFSMATSEKTKGGGELTEFHNCILGGKIAQSIAPYLTKGQMIYLEGKINHKSSEKADGTKTFFTNILGQNIKLLGGKKDSPQQQDMFQKAPPVNKTAELKNVFDNSQYGGTNFSHPTQHYTTDDIPF